MFRDEEPYDRGYIKKSHTDYIMENIDSSDDESRVYKLLDSTDREQVFVLINPHEIDILKKNRISVHGIQLHYFDKYNLYQSYANLLNTYKDKKYEGKDVYLLGSEPLLDYHESASDIPPNIHFMSDFNCLKYLSKYGPSILNEGPAQVAAAATDNAFFVRELRKNDKNTLFYCPYNTGLVGVEGYLNFHEYFYKYLDTINTIYLINSVYVDDDFSRKVQSDAASFGMESSAHKIKHINIDVCELYRTNPELIAYYRIKINKRGDNYLDKYYQFNHTFSYITDRIIIGNDSYKYIGYHKSNDWSWFPSDKITHIINVSTDEIELPEKLVECGITYEHYPIDERKENCATNKTNLFRAAERIHELMCGYACGFGGGGGGGGNGHVYIHCSLGMNRSPAAVLLYFMKYRGFSLYDAFATVAKKRQIMTSVDLFDTIYKFAFDRSEGAYRGGDVVSPLKLRTNYVYNFCQLDAYYYALYDMIYIAELNENQK